MADELLTQLDPVQGLVDYVEFVKPYHTKVLEVLVEYIHTDCIDVTITEDFYLSLGMPDPELLPLWGWTLEEAQSFFNTDYNVLQITDANSSGGYFEVVGDQTTWVATGDTILVRTGLLAFEEFTVASTTVVDQDLTVTSTECKRGSPLGSPNLGSPNPPPDCKEVQTTDTYTTTRIFVNEAISPSFGSSGVVYPATSWTYNARTETYEFNGGIVWPSLLHVDRNIDCGGYGSSGYDGTRPTSGLGVPVSLLEANSTFQYFEIDNTADTPDDLAEWSDAFTYGVKFSVSGSTAGNNSDYTVLTSVEVGSRLRVYTIGNILADETPSGSPLPKLEIRRWGYDEPEHCIDEGQALQARAHIAEYMILTLNDNGANILDGWDLTAWDIAGWDGGAFTYPVQFT